MTVNIHVRGHAIPQDAYIGQEMACKHCGRWPIPVWVPIEFDGSTPRLWGKCALDACIAEVVRNLNRAGIYTAGCCCGHHGPCPPNITLWGKREIGLADARRLLGH